MSFNPILDSFLGIKKAQLHDQATKFDQVYSKLKKELESILDPVERLDLIIKAGKEVPTWEGPLEQDNPLASDYLNEVQQRSYLAKQNRDPNDEFFNDSAKVLIESFDRELDKYRFANMFFDLFEEENNSQKESSELAYGDSNSKKSNIQPRQEMFDQINEFESIAFDADDGVIEQEVTDYLKELFKDCEAQLDAFREKMTSMSNSLFSESLKTSKTINVDTIKDTIESYIKDGPLGNDDIKLLKSFLKNEEILKEIRDVINMKLSTLETFSWNSDKGITASVTRQLNGRYRILMKPDLLDGIFLAYVGIEWNNYFYSAAEAFYKSPAWKRTSFRCSHQERVFRTCFFDENMNIKDQGDMRVDGLSINHQRNIDHKDYFISQVKNVISSGSNSYDEDGDTNVGSVDPLTLKNKILLILIAELKLSKFLKRGHAVIRTDYNWFGPSLSHTTIRAVLKFFGVTQVWLDFFARFLETPLALEYPEYEMDNTNQCVMSKLVKKPVQIRKRGTPISFFLSSFFGEAVLFCQDFNVNQISNGKFLYRMHDDIWFWDPSQGVCRNTWGAMVKLNDVFGMKFKPEKTGFIWIPYDKDREIQKLDDSLPEGKISWGLLDLTTDGEFLIDQEQVDKHIAELRYQLSLVPSLLSWTRAYNKYIARYMINTFGDPSYASGYDHVRDILSTLERINKALFPKHQGSVTGFLREEIKKRFIDGNNTDSGTKITDVSAIPEGWFYLPVSFGGLGLENPSWFFSLILAEEQEEKRRHKEQGIKEPKMYFDKCFEKDKNNYEKMRSNWMEEERSLPTYKVEYLEKYGWSASKGDYFPLFEEYNTPDACEYISEEWKLEYVHMTSSKNLNYYQNFIARDSLPLGKLVDSISDAKSSSGIRAEKATADATYLASVYGRKMVENWGSVRPFWEICLPSSLIALWQKEKNVWA